MDPLSPALFTNDLLRRFVPPIVFSGGLGSPVPWNYYTRPNLTQPWVLSFVLPTTKENRFPWSWILIEDHWGSHPVRGTRRIGLCVMSHLNPGTPLVPGRLNRVVPTWLQSRTPHSSNFQWYLWSTSLFVPSPTPYTEEFQKRTQSDFCQTTTVDRNLNQTKWLTDFSRFLSFDETLTFPSIRK